MNPAYFLLSPDYQNLETMVRKSIIFNLFNLCVGNRQKQSPVEPVQDVSGKYPGEP